MKNTPLTFAFLLLLTIPMFTTSCKKEIGGCIDPASRNYNPEATMDDGSCEYVGCTDPNSDSFNPQANVDNGTCTYQGCTDPDATNFDPKANVDNATCTYERDQFLGNYSATEECVSGELSGTFNWDMTVGPGTSADVAEVMLDNLGNYGKVVPGQVDGDKVTFLYDDGQIRIEGTGTLDGNELSFTYRASLPTSGIGEDCTGVATRQ